MKNLGNMMKQVQEMQASWRRYVALKNEYHQAKLGDCF